MGDDAGPKPVEIIPGLEMVCQLRTCESRARRVPLVSPIIDSSSSLMVAYPSILQKG